MGWKYTGVSVNDSFIIGEIDIFKEDWKSTDNIAHVVEPLYGQKYVFTV